MHVRAQESENKFFSKSNKQDYTAVHAVLGWGQKVL